MEILQTEHQKTYIHTQLLIHTLMYTPSIPRAHTLTGRCDLCQKLHLNTDIYETEKDARSKIG